jgi:FkbM family methyltransferase
MNFDKIFQIIKELNFCLIRGTATYHLLEEVTKNCVQNSEFATSGTEKFGSFGILSLPFLKMGNITTLDLFGLDEIILFAWYEKNKDKYSHVADLGANVGLHSILMSKLGWEVNAYEADPNTVIILTSNLEKNNSKNVLINNKAVSVNDGNAKFIRVKNNLTGSHLAGAKENPYGALDTFDVPTLSIKKIMSTCDFMKIDVEGSEADIIKITNSDDWQKVDAMMEIGSSTNSQIIFDHLNQIGVNMYSQKNSWELVSSVEQLPHHHTEGTVFCSSSRNFFE